MTYKIFFLFSLFLHFSTFGKEFNEDKYYKLGLVLGVLKYHDSEISNGKQDWNKICLKIIEEVEVINSEIEFEKYILELLNKCSYVEDKNEKKNIEIYNYENYNLEWIDSNFNDENIKIKLKKLLLNMKIGDFYAKVSKLNNSLSFENEKKLHHFDHKKLSHRLLFLYNFWNLTNYWNINKINFEKNWFSVLREEVKILININNFKEIEFSKMRIISNINDTHAFYLSDYYVENDFKYKPPFSVKNINDSLIVNYIYNKDLAKETGIEVDDVITKINNIKIEELVKEKLKNLISVSNETSLRRWSHFLLFNKNDSINVDVVKKNGEKINKNIKLYNQYENKEAVGISFYINDKVSIIDNETIYVNLGNITKKELSEFFKTNKNINNLIIDLRNNPKFINEQDISDYILPEKTTFIKTLSPINKKPAISSFLVSNIATKIFKPFEVGYDNKNYFKGKIILMVDSSTQSNAEFIAMAIQSSKNCITIGEQTGGSVMNITNVELLDGSKMSFTGLNAYYPNGLKVFGNGIKLDYKLNPTTKDLNPEYYVKKALEILKN